MRNTELNSGRTEDHIDMDGQANPVIFVSNYGRIKTSHTILCPFVFPHFESNYGRIKTNLHF